MIRRFYLLSFIIAAVSACSYNPAIVKDRAQPPSIRIINHKVDVGETLYSVAWRYDLNVNELARANRLDHPYIITPGQILTLIIDRSRMSIPLPSQHKVKSGDTLFSIASKYSIEILSLAKRNNLIAPYTINVGQTLTLSGSAPSVNDEALVAVKARGKASRQSGDSTRTSVPAKSKTKTSPKYSKNWQWKWPLKGSIVEGFNPNKLQKGLKIKGSGNSKVFPAAPGNVVYAGSGLRGYGKLIIIKHSEVFLSAYANNEQLLVEVGQSVGQADVISSLGANGEMYFEIRKDGNPVNPKTYLGEK
ncbi:MAG: LysM peptidoglycan-binding domain-containing protein [Porticoccaceae bacterium]|nr:LysM peptidoglycan-binding domain-containing protein [Porticoccaceae bacterium]